MSEKAWILIPETTRDQVRIIRTFPTVIGKSPDCDIALSSPSVSARHAQITQQGKTIEVQDLGSTKGTFVNGEKIQAVRIKQKETVELRIGHVPFTLTYDDVPPSAPKEEEQGNWFYIHNNLQHGPVTVKEMFDAVAQGTLLPTDVVWNTEANEKVKGFEVDGLFDKNVVESLGKTPAWTPPVGTAPAVSANVFHVGPQGKGAITCPCCWYKFDAGDMLFIARHEELRGDPILGADEMQRFLPSRLTPDGHAVDSNGMICPDIACPRCHLRLPLSVTSSPPLFVSIVGAPGSGKSYLLACMCWKLRTTLPQTFGIRFTDADSVINRWLNNYEEQLFMQTDDQQYQVIEKTQLGTGGQVSLYREVFLQGMKVLLPLPSAFTLLSDPHAASGKEVNRTLIFYDNAGEHFEPGVDSSSNPGTQHLIHSEGIIFLFDPTKDARFRKAISSNDTQMKRAGIVQRQDTLLNEMIRRIRLYLGMDAREKGRKPFIVVVSKADVLGPLVADIMEKDPWEEYGDSRGMALNMTRLMNASFAVRSILMKYAPEIVASVEAFTERAVYLPVSALGCSPTELQGADGKPGVLAVKPADVNPRWAELPLVYLLARLGHILKVKSEDRALPFPDDARYDGQYIRMTVPGTQRQLVIPVRYAGYDLRCPDTGVSFRVPEVEA